MFSGSVLPLGSATLSLPVFITNVSAARYANIASELKLPYPDAQMFTNCSACYDASTQRLLWGVVHGELDLDLISKGNNSA